MKSSTSPSWHQVAINRYPDGTRLARDGEVPVIRYAAMSTSPKIQARTATPQERKSLPLRTVTVVLTEAGYRCAVPTCRGILALDMHHIWEVNAGGGDDASNLLALCPTDHALYHRGTISSESMYVYKAMLVAMSQAFDLDAIDRLLFLSMYDKDFLIVSGDGVLVR